MSEELKVDCFECKDLAFARNLARQMKEGYGRQIRREPANPRRCRIGAHYMRERWQDCAIGDAVQERLMPDVSGHGTGIRYCTFRIPKLPIHNLLPDGVDLLPDAVKWHNYDEMRFERVCFDVTPDNGLNWRQECVWKRIE